MKRRNLLKSTVLGLLITAGLASVVALGPPSYVKIQDYVNRTKVERRLTDLEEKLSEKYNINIRIWKEPGSLGFGDRPVPSEQVSLKSFSAYVSLKALEGLEEVLGCYPTDIIERTFSGIEIVKSFIRPWYDETWEKQDITPLARISFGGNISISVARDNLSIYHQALFDNIFEKESLHHEIGHELTRNISEEEWKALNPEAKYFPDSWKLLPEVPPGFYNEYATKSIGEDIASTVELLYSDRDNYEKRISQDPILKSKAKFLKVWYHQISDGRFDQGYWDTVQSGKIPIFENR